MVTGNKFLFEDFIQIFSNFANLLLTEALPGNLQNFSFYFQTEQTPQTSKQEKPKSKPLRENSKRFQKI